MVNSITIAVVSTEPNDVVAPIHAKAGAALVQGEPNIAVSRLVELAERRKGHDAAVLYAEPALTVLAADVPDVRGAAVRLHPQERSAVIIVALKHNCGAFQTNVRPGASPREPQCDEWRNVPRIVQAAR
jgi:hypothetical protein